MPDISGRRHGRWAPTWDGVFSASSVDVAGVRPGPRRRVAASPAAARTQPGSIGAQGRHDAHALPATRTWLVEEERAVQPLTQVASAPGSGTGDLARRVAAPGQ